MTTIRPKPAVGAGEGGLRGVLDLAAAVEVLLEATTRGEAVALDDLWELIEAVVPRTELRPPSPRSPR